MMADMAGACVVAASRLPMPTSVHSVSACGPALPSGSACISSRPMAPPSASVGVRTPPGMPAALAVVTASRRSSVTSASTPGTQGSCSSACTVLKPLPQTSGRTAESRPITSPASAKRSGSQRTSAWVRWRAASSSHRKAGPIRPAATPIRLPASTSAKPSGGTAWAMYSAPPANRVCVVSSPITAATSTGAMARNCRPPRMISATNSVPAMGAW